MRKRLIKSLRERVIEEIPPRSPLAYLFKYDVEEYIDNAIIILYLYTRPKKGKCTSILLTELISAIGQNVRKKFELSRDSALSAKTGAFILYSFEELGLIRVVKGAGLNGHQVYVIHVLEEDAICKLWEGVTLYRTEKLPSEVPYEPWTSAKHPCGLSIIKTFSKEVLDKVKPDTHPYLFETLNKAQSTGWRINKDVYNIQLWALRNKTEAFDDIWSSKNLEAKVSKLREARAILSIAKRFLEKAFYHAYYFEFRGRKCIASAYLHEQGCDIARGLLLRDESKEIGEGGFFWLHVSIANTWAGESGISGVKTDKLPLKDRYDWVVDNEEIIISYAQSPKVNTGWMSADKPWQFLAACMELWKIRQWQYMRGDFEDYSYKSQLECFIDGSTNGTQHLTALTRDETTAPLVNLVPMDMPGDLYAYAAENVWTVLNDAVFEEEQDVLDRIIDEIIIIKQQIHESELGSERRKNLIEEIRTYREANKSLLERSAPVFWRRITDLKSRRKICKRNLMTLSYGMTAYGAGEQQIEDAKKHGIELLLHMEHRWGSYMGRLIYENCKVSLERPMRLLNIFEAAGKRAEKAGKYLSWTVPITNFPVVQYYVQGVVKKIYVQYGPPKGERKSTGYFENTFQLAIAFVEDTIPQKGKQSQGASPNIVHSLDAAHLMLVVNQANFNVTTIHDSFGCHLGDMPTLYKLLRTTFLELYKENPLIPIMKDIGADINQVDIGTLKIESILESEFCFA